MASYLFLEASKRPQNPQAYFPVTDPLEEGNGTQESRRKKRRKIRRREEEEEKREGRRK